jgi:ribosomal protein S27E
MSEPTSGRTLCRHCGDPLGQTNGGEWAHQFGPQSFLYRCQNGTVTYGHNAAHPDVPCVPGGPNPCRCTYA